MTNNDEMALKLKVAAERATPFSLGGEESWFANPWVWCIYFKRVEG
ncbi:hypothetical protein ACQYRI_10055 [Salmonella enterica]